jgi:hypothetical protein
MNLGPKAAKGRQNLSVQNYCCSYWAFQDGGSCTFRDVPLDALKYAQVGWGMGVVSRVESAL